MQASKHVNTHTNNNIYGNALEALMGAIYLDYGYKQCKKFVEQRLITPFMDIDKIADGEVNFKSKIIEWSQKHKINVDFVLVKDELLSANKHVFHTSVMIGDRIMCEATGQSKKESQQNAARLALQKIMEDPDLPSSC